MSTFEISDDVQNPTNSAILNESTSILHQINKKRIRTVDNTSSSITAGATISTSKIATNSSTTIGKGKIESVVSSLYTSVERQDSIHYLLGATKVNSCILPAVQNTVIHLDNYTRFMRHRITTVSATATRSEILAKEQERFVSCSTASTTKTPITKSNIDVVDVNLSVLLGGMSSYCAKKQTKAMHKQNLPAKNNSRKSSGKKSLKIELPKSVENTKNIVDLKKHNSDLSVVLKPTLKKSKINRRKKPTKKQTNKNKSKVKDVKKQKISIEETNQTDVPKHFSRLTQTEREWKILKPCCSLLQNRKCATELTCPYLHSDFPCKYYYLSLPCPQGLQCQFMHNGPLAPRLLDALRRHIQDLLSTNLSHVEISFVKQMSQIDDIFKRLLSFQKSQHESGEIIEVFDDCIENKLLAVDGDSNELIADASRKTFLNYSLQSRQDDQEVQALQTTIDENLDDLYDSFKKTNDLLEQYDQKLKNIKTATNLTSNEKIKELQKIYELLREQERLFPLYENVNSSKIATTISPNSDNNLILTEMEPNDIQFNEANEETNLVLVSPHDSTNIHITGSQESSLSITDYEDLLHKSNIEIIDRQNISQIESDITENKYSNQICSNDTHMIPVNYEAVSPIEMESISNEINDNSIIEDKELVNEKIESDSQEIQEILYKNKTSETNENTSKNDYHLEHNIDLVNETLELNKNYNENESIEHFNLDHTHKEDEISPPYEKIPSPKALTSQDHSKEPLTQNRIRLRSHSHQDIDSLNATEIQEPKKVKRRRLRLPKPNRKTIEKSYSECQIDTDIINELIKQEKNIDNTNKEIPTSLENMEDSLPQNVIFSQKFLRKARAKVDENSKNVEQNNCTLRNEDHISKINTSDNNYATQLTQTSDNIINSFNPSQDCVVISSESDNEYPQLKNEMEISKEIEISKLNTKSDVNDGTVSFSQVLQTNNEKMENNLKSYDSLESINSSLTSSHTTSSSLVLKQKFNLGHPYVALPKLKRSTLKQTDQNEISADTTLQLDNRTAPKRRSLSPEYGLDSSNKCLKISDSQNVHAINTEHKIRTNSEQSDLDFDHDTGELTIEDEINSSIAAKEQQKALELHTAQATNTFENREEHYNVQQLEYESESDLPQQEIENESNKSDLQIQSEKQKEELNLSKHKKIENETIASCSITVKSGYEEVVEKDIKSANEKSERQNANKYNPYLKVEIFAERQQKAHSLELIDDAEKSPTDHANSYSSRAENKEYIEFSKYASLYNKLTTNTSKYQINCGSSTENITPIASPSYGDDSIASPSPVNSEIDFRICSEIDGRLTYPPIPYVLYEIDLEKIYVNRPLSIDKLEKTKMLDPRIFRTSIKKQTMTFHKPVPSTSKALVPVRKKTDTTATTSMLLPYDPRIRSSAGEMANVEKPTSTNQSALAYYNINQVTTLPYTNTDMQFAATVAPFSLDYNPTQAVYPQVQQQQSPNMFIYGCLQRSPWYQSLMSTMKIQINQSISQLVRALNNFHRERLLNPTIVFDVFKIDCAGEVLEIMRNLDIFIDSNGVINEKRNVPSFAGRSCCNATPVNSTYSFIQQVLTPNTQCTSMATTCSSRNTMDSLNIMEPFVSCYVKAPDSIQKLQCDCTMRSSRNENNTCGCNCKKVEHHDDNHNLNNDRNNNQSDRQHYNKFKKPYDNSSNNNSNNNYQQRSNQRSYNKSNPRFTKPSEFQNRSSSPSRDSNDNDNNSNNYSGGGRGGGGGGRGRGGGGRFNNNFNKRFNSNNNYNNTWSSSLNSSEGDTGFNDKYSSSQSSYNSSNSPTKASFNSSHQQGNQSPRRSPVQTAPAKSTANEEEEEECWD